MYVWDDLRFFLEVARRGSLAAAGKRLRVAPTTVSRRISALERDLGARLFLRQQGTWQLTSAGERMLDAAQRAEQAAVEVTRRVEEAEAEPEGTVRLTTLEVLATSLIAPALPRLLERHPRIELDIRCTARRLDLRRGQADIAVRIGRPEQDEVVARRLVTAHTRPYVSRGFLASRGLTAEDVTTLADFPWVRLTYEPEWAGERGPLRPRLSVTSASVQLRACREGAGVAMLADVLAHDEPELVPLTSTGLGGELELWLAMAPGVAKLRRVRAVADFLTEVFLQRGPVV